MYDPIGEDLTNNLYVLHITTKWACKGNAGAADCNGRPDPPSCLTEYAGKCNDVVIGNLVRENCPVMCSTCDMCNQGCIPKGMKRKAGQPDCCTEGRKSLKCPGPAHYRCGVHLLRSNQTVHTATAASATPAEQ